MRCAVFGGGGFIGSAIADRLLAEGHTVRVFERPRVEPYRAFRPEEKIEWTTGDLLNSGDVGAAVDGVDAALHLVSTTLPKGSNDDPIYDVQTNVVSSLQLLKAAAEQGVGRVVFISSGGTVYGVPRYLPIDETHPTDPIVSYGITKLAIEKYVQLYARIHGTQAVVLRVSNAFGERQRIETAQGAIGVFVHRALHGQPIEIWGDGSVVRDYVHVSDVADAFSRALRYGGPYSVFNIGSGRAVTLNGVVDAIERVVGFPVERRYLPGRSFDVPANVLDATLARNELDWSPRISLEEGIARTAEWMRGRLSD